MIDQFEFKIINLRVVKLRNRTTITCVPRLDLDHFNSQLDSLRLVQRLLKSRNRFHTVSYGLLKLLATPVNLRMLFACEFARTDVRRKFETCQVAQHSLLTFYP